MRILRSLRELLDAVGDWERYQQISREQFFSDPGIWFCML